MTTMNPKYGTLIERLYQKTILGEIEWQHDEGDNFVYTSLRSATIFIEETQNSNFEPSMEVDLRGGDSQRNEVFRDDDLAGSPSLPEFGTWYELMYEIRSIAFRQATGADARVDAILNELGEN